MRKCEETAHISTCAESLLILRCYQIFGHAVSAEASCVPDAVGTISFLDFDRPANSDGQEPVTAFKRELFGSSEMQTDLQALIRSARIKLNQGKPFSFFDYTFSYFNRDLGRTLQIMGVLFQDSFIQ